MTVDQSTGPERVAPPKDSDEYRACIEHALNRVTESEQLQDLLRPEWSDNYRAFRALPTRRTPTKKKAWQSDVRSPYIFEQAYTLLPRLVEGRPRFEVLPQHPDIDPQVIRAQRRILDHTLWKDDFPMKSARAMLNTILFGVGWSKQAWLYNSVTRSMFDRQAGKVIEKPLITANRSTTSIPHPFDVMWDPQAQTLELCRYVVIRTVTTVGQVRAKQRKRIRDKGGVERWAGMYDNTEHVQGWSRDRDYQLPNEVSLPEHVSKRCKGGKVELLEILDRERDRIYVIANRNVLLRDQRMPWWHGDLPVACAVTTPDVGTLHGISEIEMMKGLQEMLWLLEHQRLDNTRLQMDLVLLIRDTVDDLDDYQLEPGAKWPVRDPSDVQPLQYPQPQLASITDLEMLRGRLQAVAGTAYMAGAGDGAGMGVSQDTASGLLAIIEEGNRRVDFRLNLVRSSFYERIAGQHLSLLGQYLQETVFVPDGRSEGADPIPVSPSELSADTYVRSMMMNDSGLKSLNQQRTQLVIQAFQALGQTPIPTRHGMKQPNPMVAIEMLADSIDRDAEELLADVQATAPIAAPPGLAA